MLFPLEVAGPSLWVCSFNGYLESGHRPMFAGECTASSGRSLVDFYFILFAGITRFLSDGFSLLKQPWPLNECGAGGFYLY